MKPRWMPVMALLLGQLATAQEIVLPTVPPTGLLYFASYPHRDNPAPAGNPYLVGALFTVYWSDVETREGVFDWSSLDRRIAVWTAPGKKVAVRIMWSSSGNWPEPAAKRPTPQFVLDAGAVVVRAQKSNTEVPLVWDPVHRRYALRFLREVARKFDGDPNVLFLDVTPGAETNPYRFRRINVQEPEFKERFLNTPASDGRRYSHELWLETVKQGVDEAKAVFQKTPLLVTLNVGSLDGPEQFQAIGAYSVGRGCYVGQNGLNARSYEADSPRKRAFLEWSEKTRLYFETVDASGGGTGSLMDLMRTAERIGCDYLGVYAVDVLRGTKGQPNYDPKFEEALAYGASVIGKTSSAVRAARSDPTPHNGTTVKRIYLAPDDHTDYMWTLDEEGYRRAFIEMLDYYLDQIDATASNPPPYQARWNCDGSFWLWTYERNKSPQEFERLIARVRDGHISVPLTALSPCYGGQPAEAVLRGMYYAGTLERRYGLRLPLAYTIEDQTMPFGLGALWAGAGAKYSWHGICACASRMKNVGDREHDIYWWKGADGSRILMKWNSLLTNNQSLGGYAEARDPFGAVDLVDNDPRFQRRWPYPVIGAFGKGWDDAKTLTDEFIHAAQGKTTGTRQVIVSNEEDFFRDFETTCGTQIPEVSASFGNEWDLYSASLAEVTARVRRAVEKLRNAEAMATLVSLQQPDFARDRAAARDQAWMNLGLYWEHDWTADGKIISREARAAWQRRLAEQIESYVYGLHVDATQALGAMIRSPIRSVPARAYLPSGEAGGSRVAGEPGGSVKAEGLGDGPTTSAGSHRQASLDAATQESASIRFFAFNSLGWARTDVADLPWSDPEPVHVVDVNSGRQTPSQRATVDGQRCLRVLARDVPPVGYKVFEIRPGAGETYAAAATVTGSVMENGFYRITVAARGAITSLIDKTRGNREFAANIQGRAINDLGPGSGGLEVENAGPVSVTLLALSTEPLAHTSRVTLIRDSRRIEIDNAITQNFGDVRTWSFAFNLTEPDVWHEEVGAVIRGKLLAQGGHYAPRNARYDWLTLNHFADMGESETGVTLANADCCFMQLGHSTLTKLDTATPLISVLLGGQVDGPRLGIPNQGGDRYFRQRFALQTRDRFDPVAAIRFALEHQNPLVAGLVTGGSDYPEESFSLLRASRPELFVWAVKPAEEGIDQGAIVRIWNMAPHAVSGAIEFGRPVSRARRTTHVETDVEDARVIDGRLSVSAAAQQLQTYRLTFARRNYE